MPIDLLRRIERASLPLVIQDEKDVRNAIVLEAAAMIKAHLPTVDAMGTRPVVIFRITDAGRRALSESGSSENQRETV
jgi:hypothetical protein